MFLFRRCKRCHLQLDCRANVYVCGGLAGCMLCNNCANEFIFTQLGQCGTCEYRAASSRQGRESCYTRLTGQILSVFSVASDSAYMYGTG